MKKYLWIAVALVSTSCGGALAGGTINFDKPATIALRAVSVMVHDEAGRPVAATCGLDGGTDQGVTANADGYVLFATVPASLRATQLTCTAPGFEPYSDHRDLATGANEELGSAMLLSLHVDPTRFSLDDLAAIRGAMWPLGTAGSCGPVPLGPRPGQPDNVIATVFITDYPSAVQDCIIAEIKGRGYTHVVMGPLVDSDGYHGIWQPNDWRGANFERFLDAIQKFYDNGLKVVVFIKPDNWSLDQMKAELTPLLSQPRAKRLIRIRVPMGWEAGAAYEYSSCTWAEAGRWINEVLGDGITLVHMVSDRDAPAGTDARCNDDDHVWNPGGNAAAWARVVPFYHGWLTQSGAFDNPTATGGDREHPELTNFQNWQRQFNPAVRGSYRDRFEHGYAGWPLGSAWGINQPLLVYAGEYSAYWKFWQHRTEAEGVTWGNAAIAAGAAGYLDSGDVPVRR